MDGVLVDLWGSIEQYFNLKSRTLYKTKNPWDIHLSVCMTNEDFWGKFDRIDFWAGLPKYPWSDDLIEVCLSNKNYKTMILTSPSKTALSCATDKLCWISRNYPNFIKKVIIINDKNSLAGPNRVLIDDTPKKVFGFIDNGGRLILLPQQYNKDTICNGDKYFFKPKNIKEVFKVIRGLR